jgi:hypothetical protein
MSEPGNGQSKKAIKKRALLTGLWIKVSGLCHWCQRLTVLPYELPKSASDGVRPPNMATIDHLVTRLQAPRGKLSTSGGVVLACNHCNHQRDLAVQYLLGKITNPRKQRKAQRLLARMPQFNAS